MAYGYNNNNNGFNNNYNNSNNNGFGSAQPWGGPQQSSPWGGPQQSPQAPWMQQNYDPQTQYARGGQVPPYTQPKYSGRRRKSPLPAILLCAAGVLILAAVALVLLNLEDFGGSRTITYDSSSDTADRGTVELLTLSADAYQAGDHDAAITLLDALLASTDSSVSPADLATYREAAVVGLADCYAAKGDLVRAQQILVEYSSCLVQNDTDSLIAMYAGGTQADILTQFADGADYTAALADYTDNSADDDGSYQAVLNAYANDSAGSMLAGLTEAEGLDFAYSLDNPNDTSRYSDELPYSAWTVTQIASDSHTKVWYASADLDGDGNAELLIGTGRSSGSVTLSEIYTMSGGMRVRLLARTDTLALRLLDDMSVLGTLSGTDSSTASRYVLANGTLTVTDTYTAGTDYTVNGSTVSKSDYNAALGALTDASLAWTQVG